MLLLCVKAIQWLTNLTTELQVCKHIYKYLGLQLTNQNTGMQGMIINTVHKYHKTTAMRKCNHSFALLLDNGNCFITEIRLTARQRECQLAALYPKGKPLGVIYTSFWLPFFEKLKLKLILALITILIKSFYLTKPIDISLSNEVLITNVATYCTLN